MKLKSTLCRIILNLFYAPQTVQIKISLNEENIQDFKLIRIPKKIIKVVLSWSSRPSDLDSQLFIPNHPHIFFRNKGMEFSLESGSRANLDTDVTNGYGPETMLIGVKNGKPYFSDDGIYRYLVYHYGGDGSIKNSGAKVSLYYDDELVGTFTPPDANGRLWNVFNFEKDGAFKLVNEMKANDKTKKLIEEIEDKKNKAVKLSRKIERKIYKAMRPVRKSEKYAEKLKFKQAETQNARSHAETVLRDYPKMIEDLKLLRVSQLNVIQMQKEALLSEKNKRPADPAAIAESAQTLSETETNLNQTVQKLDEYSDELEDATNNLDNFSEKSVDLLNDMAVHDVKLQSVREKVERKTASSKLKLAELNNEMKAMEKQLKKLEEELYDITQIFR